jgi:Flp pilus assembly protein TadG
VGHPIHISGSFGRRRGAALITTLVMLVALCGVASLAVDLGRAQLAKSELRSTADAAARAACEALPGSGMSGATAAAAAVAATNTCDGQAVVVNPNTDIVFGTWDPTARKFASLAASGQASPNAVKVTIGRTAAGGNPIPLMFGKVIGLAACDVRASSTTCVIGNTGAYSIIGIKGININGYGFTDSYNSSKGGYSAGSAHHKGSIASNGNITLAGSARIDGDSRAGVGMRTTRSGAATVTGLSAPLGAVLKFPSVKLPSSYVDLGDVVQGSGTVHIPGGVYLFHSITLSGTAHIVWDGPVVFYVRDSYSVSGSVIIDTYQNIPANRVMNFLPTCTTATWSGTHSCVGELYAPDTDFIIGGSAELFGRITAETITLTGDGGLHYDEALAPIGTSSSAQSISRVE